jgi:crotonobetainyl-CoA:carnitine CoA-transferase CaiB-like acyl-CoA transferase
MAVIQPLQDIHVLDLSRFIAGPHCAALLGDMGADVIKVERPGGEDSRSSAPFYKGQATYTMAFNRNKRAVTLDTHAPEGKALLRRLVEWADVIVENYRPGTMDRMGFGFDDLQRINPRVILTSISGVGQTGPDRDTAMFDCIAQARSGLMSRNGPTPDEPELVGTYIGDYLTAVYGALGTMFALYARERTGAGQRVDVALLDALFSSLGTFALQQVLLGRPLVKNGNRDLHAAPGNLFEARDGKVYIHAGTDPLFARFAAVLGRPELVDDSRFRTLADRMANVEATEALVADWVAERDAADVERELGEAGIPASRVQDMAGAVNDPQLLAREMLVRITHPQAGEVVVPGIPTKLSATPGSVRSAPPLVGEHNHEIYRDLLGLDEEEIAALRSKGVI